MKSDEAAPIVQRLEKLIQRFGDSNEEAANAFNIFRQTLTAHGVKAVDLRLELDGANRASADALLRAFDKINTPTKQKIHELEEINRKGEAEVKRLSNILAEKTEELRILRKFKQNRLRKRTPKSGQPRKRKQKIEAENPTLL